MIDFFVDWFLWGWDLCYTIPFSELGQDRELIRVAYYVTFAILSVLLFISACQEQPRDKIVDFGKKYNWTATTILIICIGFWWIAAPIAIGGYMLFNVGKELKIL